MRLRFPFDRRLVDLVKTLPNRRWNAGERYWSAPDKDVEAVVDLLHDEGFSFCETTVRLYGEAGGRQKLQGTAPSPLDDRQRGLFDSAAADSGSGADTDPAGAATATADYTVATLNERARQALAGCFPAPVWLVGEISGFNKSRHKRTVGFQLVENDPDGRNVSQVNATLFDETRQEIQFALARAGNPFQLEDELRVRMRVRVDLYVPWGSYRVVVEELDVNFTLGEAARRRELILKQLSADGLLERNNQIPLPAVPLRIGVITSVGSDAYNDTLRTFQESGHGFAVTVHGARVQGHATESSILNALDWFRAREEAFDLILICRGGGSRTDLAWFDSEKLGRTVALYPLPVIVGVGHEQDQSVLDAVARSRKTPTAAAAFIVEQVTDFLGAVEQRAGAVLLRASQAIAREEDLGRERGLRIGRATRLLLEQARKDIGHRRERIGRGAENYVSRERRELLRHAASIPRLTATCSSRARAALDAAARQLSQASRRDLEQARRRVDALAEDLEPVSARYLRRESERGDNRAARLRSVDPRRVVERGYAILRSDGGQVITEAAAAPAGAEVHAELRHGTLRLRSEGASESAPEGASGASEGKDE
ncbi:hypothetical protein ABI59_19745 [Acidobacteria bacterium Mor1]|nr:hypothetical protein ABI59_19745 [Acidobacteria bacterium Mor1]